MASAGQVFEFFSKLATNIDWTKIDPEELQELIRRAPSVSKEFERFIKSGGTLIEQKSNLPVQYLMDIKLDSFPSKSDFLVAWVFAATPKTMTDDGKRLFDQISFSYKHESASLCTVRVGDLGLNISGSTTENVFGVARIHGLQTCLPCIGPLLRNAFRSQPKYSRLFIAMDPFSLDERKYIFVVENCDQGLRLDAWGDSPSQPRHWAPNDIFVFTQQ